MSRQEGRGCAGRLGAWLGLGVLGALIVLLWPEKRRGRGGRFAEPPTRADGPALGELPEGAVQAWVPGPSGSLRVIDHHPEAGRALIFVHGLGGRLEHWAAQLAALGSGLRGLALDLPGHGGSDLAADGDYSPTALASAVLAVADAFGLRRFTVVGHDLGAAVALEVAARRPGSVEGVLLVDPHGDPTRLPEDERAGHLERLAADPLGETEWSYKQLLIDSAAEVADRVLEDLRETPEEVLMAATAAHLEHSPIESLDPYEGVVCNLVSATNDLPWSLHRLRPRLPTAWLGASSHWPMLDQPDAVNRELDRFLDAVRAHAG